MKRLLSFIMILALSCMAAPLTWADNQSSIGMEQLYDGIYEVDPQYMDAAMTYSLNKYVPDNERGAVSQVRLVADRGAVTLFFTFDGQEYELEMEQTGIYGELEQGSLTIGIKTEWSSSNRLCYKTQDGKEYLYNGYLIAADGWIAIHHLIKSGDIEPSAPAEISTSFQQQVTTDSGQYNMYLSGFLNMELVNGENILTNEEIQAQSISIHVKNIQNGVTRVMTQSTIEGVSVQVAQGVIKQITIKGRVQTSGGTLERYLTDITF